jgi:ADP-dependent NAD(P)H-hydrate dehydratase / NAD(P)H-hydrate epimerase
VDENRVAQHAPGLPLQAFGIDATRSLERAAIAGLGIAGLVLMRRAGHACFEALRAHWPMAKCIAVVCGAGNNAGDGFVLATLAQRAGFDVRVHVVVPQARFVANLALPDACAAYADMCSAGVNMTSLQSAISDADVIVDALLGIGLSRALDADFSHAIALINAASAAIVAVDVPSGLDADTGAVAGACVGADLTCTFITLKLGLLTARGPSVSGAVIHCDLGLPAPLLATASAQAVRIDAPARLMSQLPRRAIDAHKGNFGHALIIGGERPYAGAVLLATQACVHSGAGLVSVMTRPAHASTLVAACPEAMFVGVDDAAELPALAARATVLAIGPGLGTTPWSEALLRAALSNQSSIVLDADALNLLASGAVRETTVEHLVLTPHPGEAARLLNTNVHSVQAERWAAAQALAERYGAVCVLKGAGTIIASPGSAPSVAVVGNPGLAAGGSGDTLTGIIAALIAQRRALGLTLREAVELSVCAHGVAADRAARSGERGMRATDVIAQLRGVLNPGVGACR